MYTGTAPDLSAVWGSARGDVFTVGDLGVILHYDGTAWAPMESGTTEQLIDVWGTSGSNVFAVGDMGTILHFDGGAWRPMDSHGTEYLESVHGTPAGDIFVTSYAGDVLRLSNMPTPYGGGCAAPIPLYCTQALAPYYGSNDAGRTALFDAYGALVSCPGARPTTGRETFYRLDCPVAGTVTVRLTPAAADLDLIVLGENEADPRHGCDPTHCVAASHTPGLAMEEVTFAAMRDTRYFVVVDGYDGAVSGYTLEILCAKQ
jgi:hypothetical protein